MSSITTPAAPWDVYREIHKAMRLALFGVTARRAAPTPPTTVRCDPAARRVARRASFVLLGHHGHEDEFCDPLIQRATHRICATSSKARTAASTPRSRRSPTRRHRIEACRALGGARRLLLAAFHLDLADFTADYLDHLRFEEYEVMPALNARDDRRRARGRSPTRSGAACRRRTCASSSATWSRR